MNLIVSAVLIIVAIIGFACLASRGIHITLVALLAGIVVSIGSADGFINALFITFPGGMASFIEKMSMPILFGMTYGFILTASGVAESIGTYLGNRIGSKYAPYVVFLLSIIFAASGMSASAFVVAPISYSLMKAANLPNYIGLFAFCCGLHLTLYSVAGIPCTINILPTTYLGTTLYAGAAISYLSVSVGYIVSFFAIRHYTKKAKQQQIGFDVEGLYGTTVTSRTMPGFGLSLIPILIVLVCCFVLVNFFNVSSSAAACASQTIAIMFTLFACQKHFEHGWKTVMDALKNALAKSSGFLISCACLSGFASVVAATPFYNYLLESLFNMSISPYIMIFASVTVISAITADAPSGVIMTLNTLAPKIAEMATVNLGVVHRIATMSSTTISSLPHCGAVVQFLECFGYTHKTGYRYVFVSTVCITSLVAVIATILATIFY